MRRRLAWLLSSLALSSACTQPEPPAPPPASEPSPSPPPVIVEIESARHEVDRTACAHLLRLGLDDSQSDEQALGACLAELGRLRRDRGTDAYEAELSCLQAATDLEAAMRCELLARANAVDRPRELCQHMMAIMVRELADIQTYGPSAEELESSTDDCAKQMVKERDKLGPEVFERMATCMLATTTLAEMTGCEPKSDGALRPP